MNLQEHKVPLKLKIIRLKNTGFLTIVDDIIRLVKPPRKYKGMPGKLLFIRNDKIGDAMVTLPVLRDLKLNYPEINIHVLCSEVNYFTMQNAEYIDKVIVYNEPAWNEQIKTLQSENYDAVIDLVGMDKKLINSLRKISDFRLGSRLFAFSWLYTYYLKTNWVSEYDNELMTRKIEFAVCDCFNLEFLKRNTELPLFNSVKSEPDEKEYDILIHLGTSPIRKLDFNKEKELVAALSGRKLLITDTTATERFLYYKEIYSSKPNIIFKLYKSLEDIVPDVKRSKLLLCYDGGQVHYLCQFIQSLVLVGSISPAQWSPYEFEDYSELKTWPNGVQAIRSKGRKGHIGIFFPIWCNPCFGIGCDTRPCINNIEISYITELIDSYTEASQPENIDVKDK